MTKVKVMLLLVSILLFQIANGQQGIKFRGSDGWGLIGRYEQYFNKYNIQTYTAKVMSVDTVTPLRDMSYGVQLIVKKNNQELIVHLGPGWFVLYQDINLSVNNEIEVRGCESVIEGKKVVMAVSVKLVSKNRTLYLRDEDGIPYWCALRRE